MCHCDSLRTGSALQLLHICIMLMITTCGLVLAHLGRRGGMHMATLQKLFKSVTTSSSLSFAGDTIQGLNICDFKQCSNSGRFQFSPQGLGPAHKVTTGCSTACSTGTCFRCEPFQSLQQLHNPVAWLCLIHVHVTNAVPALKQT